MTPSPYRAHILDHFEHPRRRGHLAAPDRVGEADNPLCGDRVRMELRLDATGRVSDIAFSGEGCVIALATASMLAERAFGERVEALRALTEGDVLAMLGVELGWARARCAQVALQALQAAVAPNN